MTQQLITGYTQSANDVETPELNTPPTFINAEEPPSPVCGDQSMDSTTDSSTPIGDKSRDHVRSNDEHVVHDRSLTEMLASALQMDSQQVDTEDSLLDQVVRLESQLIYGQLCLDREREEKTTLQNHLELLNAELKEYKKVNNKQKLEIKKMSSENDRLKRELSRHVGMRRFTDTDARDDGNDTLLEDLHIAKAKFTSLKDHVVDITSRLIQALEDTPGSSVHNTVTVEEEDDGDDTPFTLVARSKQGKRLLQQQRDRARSDASQAHSSGPQTTPPTSQATTRGQAIPVVCAGGNRVRYTAGQQQQQTAPNSRATQPVETVVIGTSLTRGLGSKLNALGTNATCYTYPGRTIPEIRSRISTILPADNQPRLVVLQCGGNDAESHSTDQITAQYDSLINDIQRRCPQAKVILSKIPPRKKNKDILNSISRINTYLQERSMKGDKVDVIDICPHDPALFRKDMVHFNVKGTRVYAKQMHSMLSHFIRDFSQSFM